MTKTKIESTHDFAATVVSVHDGDTFTADVDLSFNIVRRHQIVRLLGCNAIELEDPGGPEAREHLLGLIPVGCVVWIHSYEWDKYGKAGGRIDAVVKLDMSGLTLTELMIRDGYAAAWDGGGIRPVPPWPIPPKQPPVLPIAG